MGKIRVFITGICGFIGKALANRLVELGYEVFGIDDLSIGAKDGLHPNVNFYQVDITHPIIYFGPMFLPPEARDVDIVVHLASWKIPLKQSDIAKFLITNTEGTKNVIKHALYSNAELIFASTSDIYGKQEEFKETSDSILGPTNISRWSYAISKLWSEQLLYATEGLKFNIIRYFNVYGIGQSLKKVSAPPMAIFAEQAFKKEPITLHGDGSQKRCFAYIDDVIDGTISLIESDYDREVFNIGDPDCEITIKGLGLRVWRTINPGFMAEFKKVPHTEDMEYEDVYSRVPDIEKARKMLGFEPKVGLDKGLRKTIEWQKKEFYRCLTCGVENADVLKCDCFPF